MRLIELLATWWRGIGGRDRQALSEGEQAELAALFRDRYHAFKLLLAANNKALELMAEMEGMAAGEQTFGMAFVRSRCTAAQVSVSHMVRHLDALAPGKYRALEPRLATIRDQIQDLIGRQPEPPATPLVVPLGEVDLSLIDQVGAKMANLGEVQRALGLEVPDGFVITAGASRLLLERGDLRAEIERLIQASSIERIDQLFELSSRIQRLIIGAEPPSELADAISSAYAALARRHGGEPHLALRSSALGEDSREASFAGQYRSQLNVRPEHLVEAYLDVVASSYTPQAMHYRLQRGLRDDQVAMAVGCLVMVNAQAGGVAYTGNPNDPDDEDVRITATWGLPAAVVDGRFASDEYRVRRAALPELVARVVRTKAARLVADPGEGVAREEVPDGIGGQPALDDAQAIELAGQALALESHFGSRQDVEWAIAEDGRLIILQCRPLRQLAAAQSSPLGPGAQAPLVWGGVAASPGAGSGVVCWVRRDSDALRFPDGAVLALPQPLPRWAALLGRAAAVVAEEGSMAGHLATVAREFGVPALLGIGPGLQSLTEGELVTVDVDRLAVYSGRFDEALERSRRRPIMMAGSPVHGTLLAAVKLVAPLTLLDPDAPSFQPSSCQTLHDITRFCHEQAVREMFEFGREQRFPKHASKQLYHNVPMQWWVLDLEDGFTHEVTGRYVRLEEITSVPMRAVWDGMVAVPWAGPPAASGRGLAAVLFEATTNPALATPFQTSYTQRNYFMISRHFMNLQSRFGFHFSAVETLAGPRPAENYLGFSFKGGAADLARRVGRIRLIAELLEEHGFALAIKEDTAIARIAGLPAVEMVQRLKVIGYLLMHTRQLDVIMDDPAAVERYRSKISSDLATLS